MNIICGWIWQNFALQLYFKQSADSGFQIIKKNYNYKFIIKKSM